MLPSVFVRLERFPIGSSGKIDRDALPVPETNIFVSNVCKNPTTDAERSLVSIWTSVLQQKKIGVSDNFFSIGGHSLLGVQVISRIRDVFSIDLPIKALFDFPTIEELSKEIDRYSPAEIREALPTAPDGVPIPLSYSQQRVWFIENFQGAASDFNIPVVYYFDTLLNAEVVQQCIDVLVDRHEMLRATFINHFGNLRQVVKPRHKCKLIQASIAQQDLRLIIDKEVKHLFQLDTEPAIRFCLYEIDKSSSLLIINQHHIISDDWSIGILLDELQYLYSSFLAKKAPDLAIQTYQYADYSYWQTTGQYKREIERQLTFWKTKLEDCADISLPLDKPRPTDLSSVGASVDFRLSKRETDQLQKFSLT